MAEQNPAIFLQGGSHPAEDVRRFLHLLGWNLEGVAGPTDLAVSEKATPDMSVDVASGRCFIKGTEATYQGTYMCENRGSANLAISASDPTNARIDLIVARVQDSSYSGATDAWELYVVTGTAAASPVEPTPPANSLTLARVDVAAAASSITNANISDRRWGQLVTAPGGTIICKSSSRPSSPIEGMVIYETDTDLIYVHNGSAWVLMAELGARAKTWTTALKQGGNSVSHTDSYAKYTKIGRQVLANGNIPITGAGTAGGAISIAPPADVATNCSSVGGFRYFDSGNTNFVGMVFAYSATELRFIRDSDGNPLGVTTPTCANNDVLHVWLNYEAAS